MFYAIASVWPLLLGIGFMMLGNGLQSSLLGIRASIEGFPTGITGLIMSGYYIGFLAGSTLAPKLIVTVGHVRVFAALASLASISILLHSVFLDPWTWLAMRIVTGFSYAGLYVVSESWLNERANNETRGQILSVYMLVIYIGVGSGQLLLNVSDPGGYVLFIVVSALVSLALVPILLSPATAPNVQEIHPMGVLELYRVSPLGVVGAMAVGAANGAMFGMGAVYGDGIGLSIAQISIFMGLSQLGCIVLQWPIGHLSDRYDRRLVLIVVTLIAGIAAVVGVHASPEMPWMLYATIIIYGGLSFPMYSLALSHANDYLQPEQMIAASSTLVLVSGIGAILGPLGASWLMGEIGPSGLFWYLAAVHFGVGAFAIYRTTRRASVPIKDRTHHTTVSPIYTQEAALMAAELEYGQTEFDFDAEDSMR